MVHFNLIDTDAEGRRIYEYYAQSPEEGTGKAAFDPATGRATLVEKAPNNLDWKEGHLLRGFERLHREGKEIPAHSYFSWY